MKHHMIFMSFLWQPKILRRLIVDADAGEIYTTGIHMMAYDALTKGLIILQCFYDHFRTSGQCETCTTITPKFEDFLNCVPIWGQFRDCEACFKGHMNFTTNFLQLSLSTAFKEQPDIWACAVNQSIVAPTLWLFHRMSKFLLGKMSSYFYVHSYIEQCIMTMSYE